MEPVTIEELEALARRARMTGDLELVRPLERLAAAHWRKAVKPTRPAAEPEPAREFALAYTWYRG